MPLQLHEYRLFHGTYIGATAMISLHRKMCCAHHNFSKCVVFSVLRVFLFIFGHGNVRNQAHNTNGLTEHTAQIHTPTTAKIIDVYLFSNHVGNVGILVGQFFRMTSEFRQTNQKKKTHAYAKLK